MKDYTLNNTRNYELSKEQNEIVDFLLKNDYAYNSSQTGIGKTFSTLTAAIHKIIERPDDNIHFVCLLPGPAVKAFRDTLGDILGIPYNIYTANLTRKQEDARFHIFNYSSLPRGVAKRDKNGNIQYKGTNRFFDYFKELAKQVPNLWLIADEAHVLQDPNTQQYTFVELVKPLFVGMWFLTATPILNNLDGFYHMTELTHPGFWGNIYQFKNSFQVLERNTIRLYNPKTKRRYSRQVWDVIGYKNLDILKDKFNEIGIVRAKEYKLNFIYKTTVLEPETERFYNLAAEGLFSGTENKDKTKKDNKKEEVMHGARMHDLQRVVSNSHKDFKLFQEDEVSEKEQLLFKTILEVIEKDEATLIYFTYRETLERVKKLLKMVQKELNIINIHEIHGGISQNKRKKVEQGILPRDVVLITSAGTESVNLQKANNLIFYEVPFALREFIQACGRITRVDTKHNTFNVYILEAENTIDTYKKNRIIANSGVIKGVLGGSNALPTEMLDISLEDIKIMKDELLWRK